MAGKKASPLTRIQRLEKEIAELQSKLARVLVAPPSPRIKTLVHFKSPVAGIPARIGLQMGAASCLVYSSNGTGLKSSAARGEMIFNDSGSAVAGEKDCVAGYNDAGLLVVILEDC
jgi:hypothetical protein